MPRITKEEVGKIYRTKIEKTFFDRVKEVLQFAFGVAVMIIFVVAIFT